jgi:hypothetical protein
LSAPNVNSEMRAYRDNSKDIRSLLFNYLENRNATKIECASDISLSFVRNIFRSDKYVASYCLCVQKRVHVGFDLKLLSVQF